MSDRTCSIAGCSRLVQARGWCSTHYSRWLRGGDPNVVKRTVTLGMSDVDRFWARVDRRPDGCWLWTGYINDHRGGYGYFHADDGRVWRAHRFGYQLLVAPIPDGLVLDHLCGIRRCVNPEHLEPVTQAENMRRSGDAVTHCPRGHSYDDVNTYIDPTTGRRSCRACRRDRERERRRLRRCH